MLRRVATVSIVLTLVVTGAALAATRTTGMGTMIRLHSYSSGTGKVLATTTGRILYLYTNDGFKTTNCTGPCAQTWRPLKTVGKPQSGSMGVKQSLLSKILRPNGTYQVTYNGHPLYKYSGDTKAGQSSGEGFGGTWFVVTAAGNQK
jgi:predicted lipoprotein with Yx(FWY)xxD motif